MSNKLLRMQQIVIWGAQGHAKVVADAVRRAGHLQVAGFIDEVSPQRAGEAFCGSSVLGGREALAGLLQGGVRAMALAFGHNAARLRLIDEMKALGFAFPAIVHPSAEVAADSLIDEGSFVGALAVVNPAARIGRAVIVNSGVIVEHDCEVGDGVHLSPRTCLAGGVRVGALSWIGAGSTVREKLTIGCEATVGMGSVVVRSLPDGVTAFGCPAEIRPVSPVKNSR